MSAIHSNSIFMQQLSVFATYFCKTTWIITWKKLEVKCGTWWTCHSKPTFHKQPPYGFKNHTSQSVKLISDLGVFWNTSVAACLQLRVWWCGAGGVGWPGGGPLQGVGEGAGGGQGGGRVQVPPSKGLPTCGACSEFGAEAEYRQRLREQTEGRSGDKVDILNLFHSAHWGSHLIETPGNKVT